MTLRDTLHTMTREGALYRRTDDGRLECFACGHRCRLRDGREGICKVRFNQNGVLMVPGGYTAGVQVDPIEKKPFFHAYPGARALSFGMLGCDLHCAYCQNWITSQALQDPDAGGAASPIRPSQLVQWALSHKARVITSTYNEPLITSEWAVEVFAEAKPKGLVCSYVSNGNATPEVLDFLRPYVDLYKVDLKGFNDRKYRQLGTRLQTVLDSIRGLYERGFWIEIVTLVVPGFNDSDDELRDIARFLVSISADIPWHVTAFHQDYKMTDPEDTPAATLLRAAHIGREEGLHFVYAGNLPGETAHWENTYCPGCSTLLVERRGFHILKNLLENGHCPTCRQRIPGFWN